MRKKRYQEELDKLNEEWFECNKKVMVLDITHVRNLPFYK